MSASVNETSHLRPRDKHRRFSTCQTAPNCYSLPLSLEALDLSYASLTPAFVSLRLQLLSYLADLETSLALLDSPISPEPLRAKGEKTVEEARAWARDGLEMLRMIRKDICSYLPDFHLDSVTPTVESFVKSRIPDVPSLDDMRAHLPELPDFDISEMCLRLEDVRSRISDIDYHKYIPMLPERLQSLQTHLSSMEFPYTRRIGEIISEISSDLREGELEKAARDMARAMKQSLGGTRLIDYVDLPEPWRNNPFVKGGYRFIPLHDWPRLILSVFTLHNETLNIHTHFIPFLAFLFTLYPFSTGRLETPVLAFTSFALLCLFTSSLWHTMAGCAHFQGMDICARIDYVGIGWLISASVGTIVYYGFQCSPTVRNLFLALCLAIGLSGSILPFMEWFNMIEYRSHRIVFFVALALASVAPLACLAQQHSASEMFAFIDPVVPSFISYVIGLVFYASHFPERYFVRAAQAHWLDWVGGGSHAIWHVFIVLAISQHKHGMAQLKGGIGAMCAMH
ncbi:Uncharacterized protein SCP_0303760 [Sparassis crispa]|uniref:HlyIII-domain-containing protein n=1 Tax=Sparassis crispa TaxID=139825 RepID=A0A401GER2_9APHY|nr:Uncharacterized protein SCP_0303760 [Sparassis crispa]GBE80657.1 Uncharacterized protein SCP_0303760 [Sparassis crispa]